MENNTNVFHTEDEEQKNTFNNYIISLFAFPQRMFKDVNETLKDDDFIRFCLGDFYYKKYINEIVIRLPEAEKKLLDFLNKNDIQNEDREHYLYYLESVKQRLKELSIDTPNTSTRANNKVGRPKTKVKPAKDYFKANKFVNEIHVESFIKELEKEYKDKEPKYFNYLIMALRDGGYIEIPHNNALKQAFEKALNPTKTQSQQNFNNQYSNEKLKGTEEYKDAVRNIERILASSLAN